MQGAAAKYLIPYLVADCLNLTNLEHKVFVDKIEVEPHVSLYVYMGEQSIAKITFERSMFDPITIQSEMEIDSGEFYDFLRIIKIEKASVKWGISNWLIIKSKDVETFLSAILSVTSIVFRKAFYFGQVRIVFSCYGKSWKK